MRQTFLSAAALACCALAADAATKPHIVMILQDDLGHYDVGFDTAAKKTYTQNISGLAAEGIVLTNHYTHWHCSPTRRSFLSGRLPLHHGEQLSGIDTDDLDLRWTLLPQKMKQAGYTTHWYGKGHTGYKSMHHLPNNKGFDHFFGFLAGAQSYTADERWQNLHPVHTDGQITNDTQGIHAKEYSSNLYGDLAVDAVRNHDPSTPLFLYLAFQAVHAPYDPVPNNPLASTFEGMLWAADVKVGQVISALKEKQMYDNTLIVYSSDNGGTGDGNNYPLRGEKHSNWEGGVRVAAFVSGGVVPPALRGTKNDINTHIVDWYPTFAHLAGVSGDDSPPVAPLPTNPAKPFQNIYGEHSFPAVDGSNIWDMLLNRASYNISSAHQYLFISKEVVIAGEYKLLVSQPYFKTQNNGWKQPDGTWKNPADPSKYPCMAQDLPPGTSFFPTSANGPCLFNVRTDISESANIAAQNPTIVSHLWAVLNATVLTVRDCSGWTGPIPGPDGHCSPTAMYGPCNPSCAKDYWKSHYPGSRQAGQGPECAVPTCDHQNDL